MSRKLGISRYYLYLIERGLRIPSAKVAVDIEQCTEGFVTKYTSRPADATEIWGHNGQN